MQVEAIYDDSYAPLYEQLFITHPQWRAKHSTNLRWIDELLPSGGSWLDTCCGQAWHFTQRERPARCLGLDLSAAQLARARVRNPAAEFIEADLGTYDFDPPRQFDLVTNFWGAYSYLDDEAAIRAAVGKLIRWVAPGGSLYIELITPESLTAYNTIAFALGSGSRVEARSPDAVKWSFEDPGGVHLLTSPPRELFDELVADRFASVHADDVVSTLRQFVARGKHATAPDEPASPKTRRGGGPTGRGRSAESDAGR